LTKLIIPSAEVTVQDVIGKGSFGEVYKAQYRGASVAVKTMKEVSENSLKRFMDEVLLAADLRHQNVVNMVGACWENDLMALLMEYCEKGTSEDVRKRKARRAAHQTRC